MRQYLSDANRPDLLFIFLNPFLEADPDCVDVVYSHVVGDAKVDQMNKFHEVCVISRFCEAVAENNRGNEHHPERPRLRCHVGAFPFEVWNPCTKL